MESTTKSRPTTDDPLSSVLSPRVFPERTSLYCHEVAKALRISVVQVITLINEGLLVAIEITGRGNKTSREHWRVPVSAYDDYIRRRSNQRRAPGQPKC